MLDTVRRSISRYNMLPDGCRVMAAVSGGPDSVCLLHVLREVGANLAGVAHFNHKLRGEASDADERFVAALAARLDLPFFRAEAGLRQPAGNLEQEARRARLEFFQALIKDGAADRVALGHTRDDQAETVLFRILRGSGLAGLAGIHPVTENGFVRPLIGVARAEVEAFLRSRGLEWREDATNRDLGFARNRLRHELLPALARDWNPKIGSHLAQMADLAFEEERWWSRRAWFDPACEFRAPELVALARAEARRAVRRGIFQAKGDLRRIEFEHIERVLDLAASGSGQGRLRLPGVDVIRSFDWIRIEAPGERIAAGTVRVTVPGTYPVPGGEIRFDLDETRAPACANLKVELAAQIELRGWRPGDHYRPVGKSRDQKIKEMFQSARVPSWRRASWPIVECAGKIVWARGFGAAEEWAAGSDARQVLRIWDAVQSRV